MQSNGSSRSGDVYVSGTFNVIERHPNPDWRADRTMDFGCGAGRSIMPLKIPQPPERHPRDLASDASESGTPESTSPGFPERFLSQAILLSAVRDAVSR
jgi:hypothetical protein